MRSWWLDTAWLRHRNDIQAVHPILLRLQQMLGPEAMTTARVVAILDAANPERAADRMIEDEGTGRSPVELTATITDRKLLARVKRLIQDELAGYIRDGDRCVEPGCSCTVTWPEEDTDPVCAPFRDSAGRCTAFERLVLPTDPDLQAAYWAHLESGGERVFRVRRCATKGCRRGVEGVSPRSLYCTPCAARRHREAKRKYARERRHRKSGGPSPALARRGEESHAQGVPE